MSHHHHHQHHKDHKDHKERRRHIAYIDQDGVKRGLDLGHHQSLFSAWRELHGLIGLSSLKESVWMGPTASADGTVDEPTFGTHEAMAKLASGVIMEFPDFHHFEHHCKRHDILGATPVV